MAEVLKEVFVKGKEKKTEKAGTTAETTPRGARPAPTPATPPVPAKEEAGGVPEGEIGIVVDEPTNSLIIKAFHRDYRAILETIKKLDIYPKQVLIEVLLAEVTLDEANKFGIEWAKLVSSHGRQVGQGVVFQQQPPVQGTTTTTTTTGTTGTTVTAGPFDTALPAFGGLRYAIVEFGGRLSAAIRFSGVTRPTESNFITPHHGLKQ